MRIDSPFRWRHWARSLSNGVVTRRRRSLSLVFMRRSRTLPHRSFHSGITTQRFITAVNLTLQVPIRLNLHTHTRLSRSFLRFTSHPGTTPGIFSAAAKTTRFETLRLQREARPTVLPLKHTFMRDLLERTKRMEERGALQTRFASHTPGQAVSGDLSISDAAKRTSDDWWKTDAAPRTRPAPVSAPSVNLEQITSNVLRQLDQRIGAWRERMGRI